MASSAGILVWSEQSAVLRQLLGAACQKAAGATVSALTVAAEAATLGAAGAEVVYLAPQPGETSSPEAWTAALVAAIREAQPALVLVGATKLGLEVAPRVAERLGAGYGAWAVGFDLSPDLAVTAQCQLYSGTGLATYQFKPSLALLAVPPGVFTATSTAREGRTVALALPAAAPCVTVVSSAPKQTAGVRLEEAPAVLDVGQGVKQRGDLALVEALAAQLGAQVGCSRPVASDRDWFAEWLGLSGAKVKPELCLTIGVSGAIQHMVGIRDARVIAAVNNDENAAIFAQADYGVVADLYAFLPALAERLKARGVRPGWLN